MRLAFHHKQFETQLRMLKAVTSGAKAHGIEIVPVTDTEKKVDNVHGCVLFGIGKPNRTIFEAYKGCKTVYFDTGYCKPDQYYRVSVKSFQPVKYLMDEQKPSDRFERLGLELKPYAVRGEHILFDGASHKFCLWHGFCQDRLGPEWWHYCWNVWGQEIVETIRQFSKKPIIYRPRPSRNPKNAAGPIDGTIHSIVSLEEDFNRSFVVVSYGGSIGFHAMVEGVPHFAIGDSIARPLSETFWWKLDEPKIPSEEARLKWLYNVAYCQWTLDEIASGEAWADIKERLG